MFKLNGGVKLYIDDGPIKEADYKFERTLQMRRDDYNRIIARGKNLDTTQIKKGLGIYDDEDEGPYIETDKREKFDQHKQISESIKKQISHLLHS